MTLLEVRDLVVDIDSPSGVLRVVDGVSFGLNSGETLGLVGESGSGKTVTALSVLGLFTSSSVRVSSGSILLEGRELVGLARRELNKVRGDEIGMVFQEPRRSLDPAFSIGQQIAETVRAHRGVSRKDAWRRAIEMLDLVGIPHAERRARAYPFEFSGGMAQRAMLAIALSCSPKVLIADEPTTALDVTVQARVLDLIRELQRELSLGVLLISHDLGVIAETCDQVAVMYAGQLVEHAQVLDLFVRPQHPYTAALLQSIPHLKAGSVRMSGIPGSMPGPHAWPNGCRFHPRCDFAEDRCATEEPRFSGGASARCLRVHDITLSGVA